MPLTRGGVQADPIDDLLRRHFAAFRKHLLKPPAVIVLRQNAVADQNDRVPDAERKIRGLGVQRLDDADGSRSRLQAMYLPAPHHKAWRRTALDEGGLPRHQIQLEQIHRGGAFAKAVCTA